MDKFKGQDRRKSTRVPLTTCCPASFERQGCRHSALMSELSESGAQFVLEEPGSIDFASGETTFFKLSTPYGPSEVMTRVVWTRVIDGQFRWGVEFTKLAESAADPLRLLMDSSF